MSHLRFGRENKPDSGIPNTETLSREAGDLQYMLTMARDLDLIDTDISSRAQMQKHDRMRWYMQSTAGE